jgi:hypothetical protein
MLRVAVKLPAPAGRIGDYLADVAALETAGADSIWPESGTGSSAEPWILLGAIAAVTQRVRLGLTAGSEAGWLDAVSNLGRLVSGRVVVGVRPGRDLTALVDQLKSPRSVPSSILLVCRTPAEARRSARAVDGVPAHRPAAQRGRTRRPHRPPHRRRLKILCRSSPLLNLRVQKAT